MAGTIATVALAGLVTGLLVGPTALPATAAARVTVVNEFGRAEADLTYSTAVTVSGSGFQSIQGGFGGVYVFFGTVSGTWQPSQGGRVGEHFRYVPDSESRDNAGYQRFVAFPGSETSSAAHGVMSADGSWSVSMTIPGPTFQAADREGNVSTVDCRQVTCGIITIGAHGVINAANESFTPVTFADVYGSEPEPTTAPTTAPTPGEADAEAGADGEEDEVLALTAPASVGIDQGTAVVGRVLSFTGQGFAAGEQVVGTLDAGLAGVGPLVAGAQGEVAGLLQLPADLRPGTHALVLTGAASGARAEVEFQVAAAPALASPELTEPLGPLEELSPAWIAVAVAAVLLVLVVLTGVVSSVRARRRAKRAGGKGRDARAAPEGAEAWYTARGADEATDPRPTAGSGSEPPTSAATAGGDATVRPAGASTAGSRT